MRVRFGLLTERQVQILKMRRDGKEYSEIASELGTSVENVFIIEKRALKNIEAARNTLRAANHAGIIGKISIGSGTKLVEIPAYIMAEADRMKVKVMTNFTKIYDDIRYELPGAIKGQELAEGIIVYIMHDGTLFFLQSDGEDEINQKNNYHNDKQEG
ncbi:MAG: Tfx family DNA-binding protein [Nitrososphaerota archaeon]|nr:Tfx family DNA-binding protein [Nitrososphaerota archaeon]MDG6943830.1 Tfx family DNA-binding protein [Nitrososphaerota archaeon]